MPTDIDKLQIEIEADSAQAGSAIDRLTASLQRLQSAVGSNTALQKTSQQVKAIAKAPSLTRLEKELSKVEKQAIKEVQRLREELRKRKLNLDKITAVFSSEPALLKSKTPASAMITGSFIYYVYGTSDSMMGLWLSSRIFIVLYTVILSALMVSSIPMFSMKFKKGGQAVTPLYRMRIAFVGVFCVCTVLVALLGLNWSMIILLTFIIYIIMNLINAMVSK